EYSGFIEFFLYNEKYFFTGPESESDRSYGKVRPFVPISFDQLRQEMQTTEPSVEINLPDLGFRCLPGDKGYVQRGGFYIECSG
ncbi:hypothetical protein, partial [Nocardia cerradoensis]|uniref:hypothetical protein n=1 Tax=Nocardia cerradoensis TaxID=85688 RepID=UPI001CB94370